MTALIASFFFCYNNKINLCMKEVKTLFFAFHCPIREKDEGEKPKTISRRNAVPNYNMNQRTSCSAVNRQLFLFLPYYFS